MLCVVKKMSRLGKRPIEIFETLTVEIKNSILSIKGPLGEMQLNIPSPLKIKIEKGKISLMRPDDNKTSKSLHGLYHRLIRNIIQGVSKGFEKQLLMEGIGYKGEVKDNKLYLSVGYSTPLVYEIPQEVKVTVEGSNQIKIFGIDKQKVGEVSAQIRALKPPDRYKGKGIRYVGEKVLLKPGKASVKAGATAGK